jgi:TRAP-type transport system small permease protein
VIRLLERWLGYMAAASLFSMMVLTFIDVFSRKFLGASVRGTVELIELLMFGVIFVGLPLASLKGEHVFFDLLDHFLPQRLRRWQAVLSNAICALLLGSAAWLVYQRALRTVAMGDTTAQLYIDVAPFHFLAAALLLLTALMHVYLMFVPPRPHALPGLES